MVRVVLEKWSELSLKSGPSCPVSNISTVPLPYLLTISQRLGLSCRRRQISTFEDFSHVVSREQKFNWKLKVKLDTVVSTCSLILNSKCHAQTLTVHAMASLFLGGESDEVIRDGGADIIFASPEMVLGSKTWREELQNFDVKVIVVDEFHTVATWYVISMGKI